VLPKKAWTQYEQTIKLLGERRFAGNPGEVEFLQALGLIDGDEPRLTEAGEAYFAARFIRGDDAAARAVLAKSVQSFPPAAAILQLLDGVPGADRRRAESVLRSQGFGEGLTDRRVGTLLMIMNACGVIRYDKTTGGVQVLLHPAQAEQTPPSIFIAPESPYGNKLWLRRVLEACKGYIWWFDKHFMAQAFEPLWEVADGNKINNIKIVSLFLPEHQGRAIRQFQDLRAELRGRNIELAWRVVDSREVRDVHDRWIISSDKAWNAPNVNAIFSGQASEILQTNNDGELRARFSSYWGRAREIDVPAPAKAQ
jgi:hypothetical protein